MTFRRCIALLLTFMLLLTSGMTPVFAACGDGGGSGARKSWEKRELVVLDKKTGAVLESLGLVEFKQNKRELSLNIVADEGWSIMETRIFVGADLPPLNDDGNVDLGSFTFREKFPQPVSSFEKIFDISGLRDEKGLETCEMDEGSVEVLSEPDVEFQRVESLDPQEEDQKLEEPAENLRDESLEAEPAAELMEDELDEAPADLTQEGPGNSQEARDKVKEIKDKDEDAEDLSEASLTEEESEPAEVISEADDSQEQAEGPSGQLMENPEATLLEEPEVELLQSTSTPRGPRANELVVMIYVKMRGTGDRGQTRIVDAWAHGKEMGLDTFVYGADELSLYMLTEDTNNPDMFRKNISKNPDYITSKVKIEILHHYVRAQKANGDPLTLKYETADEFGVDDEGKTTVTDSVYELRDVVKPLVAVYAEECADSAALYPDKYTGMMTERASDIWAAVSLDEGNSWKRTNLSRAAHLSSFTLGKDALYPGFEFPGEVKKPNVKVQGNNILVAWTSKYGSGGQPTYKLQTELYLFDEEGNQIVDENNDPVPNPKYSEYAEEDIWGVGGTQRSKDYTKVEEGFPGIEIPYSVVWTCRGFIDTVLDEYGEPYTKITWMKPERLTSGRRDAEQVAVASSPEGFVVVWQEDPDGLRPGGSEGPGHGWSGATVNNGTDIWYTYIDNKYFQKIDDDWEGKGEKSKDDTNRPKALVPMKLPVRITDNDKLNSRNMRIDEKDQVDTNLSQWEGALPAGLELVDPDLLYVLYKSDLEADEGIGSEISLLDCGSGGGEGIGSGDGDGTHGYGLALGMKEGYEDSNLLWRDLDGDDPYILFFEKINNQDAIRYVAITADNRLMDGSEGASRTGVMMQRYQKTDGTYSAWIVLGYEQGKGAGAGSPDGAGSDDGGCGCSSVDCEGEFILLGDKDGTGEGSTRYFPDRGKNIMYHSFDFQTPDLVSSGDYLNPQQVAPVYDANGDVERLDLVYQVEGTYNPDTKEFDLGDYILDWKGEPIPVRENARRPRFIIQPKSDAIAGKADTVKGTTMVAVYKMGVGGKGDPADVQMVRWQASRDDKGNPYQYKYLEKKTYDYFDPIANDEAGVKHKDVAWTNLGAVTADDFTTEYTQKGEEYKRIYSWTQTEENLSDYTWMEPGINSRAHRGFLRGDFLAIAYVFTPNWRQANHGNDIYNCYVRRSFDGGDNWTTDPEGDGITHWEMYKHLSSDPDSKPERYIDEYSVDPGEFEPARNISLLKNNREITIEPRLVGQPGTTRTTLTSALVELLDAYDNDDIGKQVVLFPQDVRDTNTFWMSYGTEATPDGKLDHPPAVDLYYSFSEDKGETYLMDEEWQYFGKDLDEKKEPLTDAEGWEVWNWLAKDRRGVEMEQAESQIRYLPNGSVFYAVWNEESDLGNDAIFRRIFRASQVGDIIGIEIVDETAVDTFSLTFTVEDEEEKPIVGATVKAGGQSKPTDDNGLAVFDGFRKGSHAYEVSKEGYATATGDAEVIDADILVPITLTAVTETFTLSFTVQDEEGVAIVGATVAIEGIDGEETTDGSGQAVFTELAPKTYDYSINKEGYVTATGNAEIIDENVDVPVTLMAATGDTYSLTFTVQDEEGPITGATVAVTGVGSEPTDGSGQAVFTELAPDTYEYSVSKEGYETANGSKTIVNENASVTVTLEADDEPGPDTHTVTFSVDGAGGTLTAKADGNPITSPAEVAAGSTVVFTAEPNENYEIYEWKKNGDVEGGNDATLTVDNLQVDLTVTVSFREKAVEPGELCGDTSTYVLDVGTNRVLVTAVDEAGNPLTDLNTGTDDWRVEVTGRAHKDSDYTILSVTGQGNEYAIVVESIKVPSDQIVVSYNGTTITR